jgi:hypothetical protein
MTKSDDERYLQILLRPIKVCAKYRPKLGHSNKEGYTLEDFQNIYGSDPFYSWMGLDDPLMYAAHKAAGGMTSIYRQIGIGCESLFRTVIQDSLGLSDKDVNWSYKTQKVSGKSGTLYLDARIPFTALTRPNDRKRIEKWLSDAAIFLDIDSKVRHSLQGVVFEVRQGYKSKDSKRQNADIANAATAYTKGYLPCVAVLSTQIDEDISLRYRAEKWLILTGITRRASSIQSVYTFMRQVIGYDLASFFERNKQTLKEEVHNVLVALLSSR